MSGETFEALIMLEKAYELSSSLSEKKRLNEKITTLINMIVEVFKTDVQEISVSSRIVSFLSRFYPDFKRGVSVLQ